MGTAHIRFVPLHAVNEADYRHALAAHLPYSNFNLVSLHCYWPHALVALLHDGAALILDDPVAQTRYLTALTSDASALPALLKAVRRINIDAALHFVPECTLKNLPATFRTIERHDGFDYIIAIDDMLSGAAPTIMEKHAIAAACRNSTPGLKIREVFLREKRVRDALEHIDTTYQSKRNGNATASWERQAFRRCLDNHARFNLVTILAEGADGEPIGFTINEDLHNGYYMAHFGKSQPKHDGLSELLEFETARRMYQRECRWMNFQEDLNNPGLRRMKNSWLPCRMLRVYDVSANE